MRLTVFAFQLMVILADAPGTFFPEALNGEVVVVLRGVCTLREQLWKEVHYEGDLKKLDDLIDRFETGRWRFAVMHMLPHTSYVSACC